MAGEIAAGSAARKSVACAPVRTIHATIAHRTVSCASLRSMAARAPYEESRRKPVFWNHRPEFAPNRHGFRAPDRFFRPARGRRGRQMQNTAQSR
jgi:hypothetical protein